MEYGDYTATVTMEGYDSEEESIAFRSNHKNFTITLTETVETPTEEDNQELGG